MRNVHRDDIYIFNNYSDISESTVRKAFKDNVYNRAPAWKSFLRWLFISLGIGFTVIGIVFFFAYNWADMHKFAKLGLVQGLLILLTSAIWFLKNHRNVQQVILTGISVLTGVLFAVFGQIYQTGANAYDLFLSWTVFITPWVAVSCFAPLRLIYLLLVNTTIVLYAEQVAHHWNFVFLMFILILLNSIFLIAGKLMRNGLFKQFPVWFENTVAVAVGTMAIAGMIDVIFEKFEPGYLLLTVTVSALYILAFFHALSAKRVFYIALVSLSLIIITASLLLKISDSSGMLLVISLFILLSVTIVVRWIIGLQKRWSHEMSTNKI